MSKQPSSAFKRALRRPKTAPASPSSQPTPWRHHLPSILASAAGITVILSAGALAGLQHWRQPAPTASATVAAVAEAALPLRPGYLIATRSGMEGAPQGSAVSPATAFLQPSPQAWRGSSSRGGRPQDALPTTTSTEAVSETVTAPAPAEAPTEAAEVAALTEATPTEEARGIITYQVVAGDTLAGLAQRFGISAETILWANDLGDGSVLQVGQELTIPPVSGVLYTVQRGDSLYLIATQFDVSTADIVAANQLDPEAYLSVGQVLMVPGAEPLPPPSTPTPAPPPTESPAPTAVSAEAANVGQQIVAIAESFVGYPYTWGGSSPATGFDCSGFTWYVCSQAGVSIPNHDLAGQIATGQRLDISELMPGDLVFFQNTYKAGLSHTGIYVGGGQFVHAANAGTGVRYDRLDSAYYSAHYYGACRPW